MPLATAARRACYVTPPPTITYVTDFLNGSSYSAPTISVPVTPANVGDILVLGVRLHPAAASVSAVSGGGVTTWTKIGAANNSNYNLEVELWYGVVTTAGSATINVTCAGTPTTFFTGDAWEFSKSAGVWGLDGSSAQTHGSGTLVSLPSLTTAGANEMYVGWIMAASGATLSAGSTSGYTYVVTESGLGCFCYNTNVTGAQSPTATNTNNNWVAVGGLVTI